MYTNVNLSAPIGALLLLGTGLLLLVLGAAVVYSLVAKKPRLTKLALIAIVSVAGLYVLVMLIFSATSKQTALARGQEKHFCEIDCHLAYSIVDVRHPAATAFDEYAKQPSAAGVFWEVVIKTRFDEKTVGSNRGNEFLYPNSRVIQIIDERGRTYFPVSVDPTQSVIRVKDNHTSITEPLRPGESYNSTFVFDLPADITKPTLLINEDELITRFVIGHENSPLHKKTSFQLQ